VVKKVVFHQRHNDHTAYASDSRTAPSAAARTQIPGVMPRLHDEANIKQT